jgi:hypothetical protein
MGEWGAMDICVAPAVTREICEANKVLGANKEPVVHVVSKRSAQPTRELRALTIRVWVGIQLRATSTFDWKPADVRDRLIDRGLANTVFTHEHGQRCLEAQVQLLEARQVEWVLLPSVTRPESVDMLSRYFACGLQASRLRCFIILEITGECSCTWCR